MKRRPPMLPMLESGDRLTQTDFHRRYEARPDIHKAELIAGVVYIGGRVPAAHGTAHAHLGGWFGVYAAGHRDVEVSIRPSLIISDDSEVQPDVVMFRTIGARTRMRHTPDGYLEGTPDLIAEIAMSDAAYDFYDKKEVYRAAGVPEYIVWDSYNNRLRWFRLRIGAFEVVTPSSGGFVESAIFPGLRLNVPALLADDMAAVFWPTGR
ncbi:MAG: Uma2 family endonuclease [Chloroflexi bacterium]|nr:Uma2 family endonuclease [Chloroflexota bacterium]